MNNTHPAAATVHMKLRQNLTNDILGTGTLSFETSNHSYIDPTLEITGYFRATTTGNVTVNVRLAFNTASQVPHGITSGGGYVIVECLGKVNV